MHYQQKNSSFRYFIKPATQKVIKREDTNAWNNENEKELNMKIKYTRTHLTIEITH
jgi:hypothetical protein